MFVSGWNNLVKISYFRTGSKEASFLNLYGTVAEGLGRGLQNLPQQFESARYLYKAAEGQLSFLVYVNRRRTVIFSLLG